MSSLSLNFSTFTLGNGCRVDAHIGNGGKQGKLDMPVNNNDQRDIPYLEKKLKYEKLVQQYMQISTWHTYLTGNSHSLRNKPYPIHIYLEIILMDILLSKQSHLGWHC